MEYRLNYRIRYEHWFPNQDTGRWFQNSEYLAENDTDALEKAATQIKLMSEHAPAHIKGYEIEYVDRIDQREMKTRIYP